MGMVGRIIRMEIIIWYNIIKEIFARKGASEKIYVRDCIATNLYHRKLAVDVGDFEDRSHTPKYNKAGWNSQPVLLSLLFRDH